MSLIKTCHNVGYVVIGACATGAILNVTLMLQGKAEGAFGLWAGAVALFAVAKIFEYSPRASNGQNAKTLE